MQKIRVSTEDNNINSYDEATRKARERKHLDVDLLDVDEFHEKVRQVVGLLRDSETNRNLEYAIEQFTSPEYVL